jgi:aldose 1-epimerase
MWRALMLIAAGWIGAVTPGLAAERALFGKTADGQPVYIYTLTNSHGMQARIAEYGAILVSLRVPDRNGRLDDIVLGFDSLDGYLQHPRFGGAVVGRHAGRISNASLTLDGIEYRLAPNEGQDSVHGGAHGFDTKLWQSRDVSDRRAQQVEFTYFSADGEEGFPGNLTATVVYSLTDKNELRMEFSAKSDKTTVVNLMNHAYLNLEGEGRGDIRGHVLTIFADKYSPLDAKNVTTGELRDVQGTPFDFRRPTAVGARIEQDDEQLRIGKGYDHHFVLNNGGKAHPALAARVYEPNSGRVMTVLTTETSALFYSGQKLKGILGKGGKAYGRSTAFSLEVQHMPDAPTKPWLPTTILKAGDRYHQETILHFSTTK